MPLYRSPSNFLAITGATTGATSQVQAFTNGLKFPSAQPASDSTTAFRIFKADGSTAVVTVDTTNSRVGLGGTPTNNARLNIFGTGSSSGSYALWVANSNSTGLLQQYNTGCINLVTESLSGSGGGQISVIDATSTWNGSGNTFTALKLNITDTASAAGSKLLDLQVGSTSKFAISKSGGPGFYGTAPVAQQTSGANLTNNVTSGGTDDTITNYTDLTVYANDAAAIRNAIYQLARKLKQINDGLRSYGLFT